MADEIQVNKPARATPPAEKRVKIVLENNPKIPPVGLFVGHNGRPFLIKAGVPVEVPECVLNILDDAITATPIVEGDEIIGFQDSMLYPYRRVN
jgi:hypothetical protein